MGKRSNFESESKRVRPKNEPYKRKGRNTFNTRNWSRIESQKPKKQEITQDQLTLDEDMIPFNENIVDDYLDDESDD